MCVPLVFQFRFLIYPFPWKKWTDNHATKVWTASVKNWTLVRECPPVSTDTLDSVAWNEETGEEYTAELGVFVGIKKGLSWGGVVFTTLATYLPNCFLTARAVPLCYTVLVSTSLISFLSSCLFKVSTFRASEELLCNYNCLLIAIFNLKTHDCIIMEDGDSFYLPFLILIVLYS